MIFFHSNKEENKKLILMGLLSSLGAVLYIIAVVAFINNAQRIFGDGEDKFFIPVIMLMLFVLSALITGLIILGKPAMLYLDGQKKEGITLLFYTIISLAMILALVILAFLGLK